ncbi:FAD-binding domain-containing protein [Microbacterium sp. SLBN-154]|uniref:FAD-binding domain-containing protein n=1 Tax=Microbacterium sp. SLBN-154 TaxID=2768458 RepID=UPI001151F510|nr:FAD-binding domain-containing protein [Microbacterium sp. SLBN-154]
MFPPTRAAGLEALADFVPRAGAAYARRRNVDTGPLRTNVSSLSPYIRHRLVTEGEVVAAVLGQHSLSAAEKFVQEVMWRTYWKGWLEQNPEVWRRYRRDVAELIAAGSADTPEYRDAVAGRTGIDAMDAWARELVETGYLHNHTRMWFASIWVFTLRLPWQLGADFFYRHLLDGDAASNTLSWRWVAGLQTVGKTYLATASNIERYTEGRFRPQGLATIAPALSEEPLPPRSPIPPGETAPAGERLGVLLHEEDLALDSLRGEHPWLDGGVVAVAACADADARSPWGASDTVRAFTAGALADGLERAAPGAAALAVGVDPPAAVVEWAVSEKVDTVVIPYAPVGPVAERMTGLRAALADRGIALRAARRDWDSLAWPHARRGFFPFRAEIPRLLAQQGIPASSRR